MKIIGLTGKMGSGKSTAIQLLQELQHNPIHLVKFAQPLYDIQEAIYSEIRRVYTKPEGFVKDRFLMQFLGTEWGRNKISDTLWIDLWKDTVLSRAEVYPNIILISDDVRFDNEADLIKSMGGYVIKIESNKTEERDVAGKELTGHSSENGIDSNKIDYIIENNGTLDDLKTSLLTLNEKLAIW